MIRLRYVNRDHSHPFYGMEGTKVAATRPGKGTGPKNTLVMLDDGRLVVAPWGNWRKVERPCGPEVDGH